MTIHELLYEIKRLQGRVNFRELYTAALIVFVGFASFGLGRLSRLEELREPVRIEQTSVHTQNAAAVASVPLYLSKAEQEKSAIALAAGGQFVASKSGAKYHFPWCSGAQRIAEANKVFFNSVEEARKAGYTPASNCKGLK